MFSATLLFTILTVLITASGMVTVHILSMWARGEFEF